MALTAADLEQPEGPFTAALFPDDSSAQYTTRKTRYLARGYTAAGDPDADAAAKAYATYLGFTDVVTRLASTAATATLNDQGSRSITDAQRRTFEAMAAASLAEFQLLAPESESTPDPAPFPSIRSLRRAT